MFWNKSLVWVYFDNMQMPPYKSYKNSDKQRGSKCWVIMWYSNTFILSTLQNVAVPVSSSTFNQFNYLCINIIRKEIFITFAERFSIFAFCSIISIQQPIMFQQFLLLCFEEMSWDNIFIRKLRLVKCISEVFLNNWYILRFFCKFHCSQQTFWYAIAKRDMVRRSLV